MINEKFEEEFPCKINSIQFVLADNMDKALHDNNKIEFEYWLKQYKNFIKATTRTGANDEY